MYKVVYKNKARLIGKYKTLFKKTDVQKKWNDLVAQPEYVSLKTLLLPQHDAVWLLTADFKELVDIYTKFENYLISLPDNTSRKKTKTALSNVFNYDSAQEKMARFLMSEISNIHHHCYYCDLSDISSYTDENGTEYHYFEIEHILDKGKCPLVALSLFNLVPSCHHCNHTLKGTTLIGGNIETSLKLAPTINSYDFYNKVHFVVNSKSGIKSPEVDKEKINDYEVDFDYSSENAYDLYHHVVDKFKLKSRYNTGAIKAEAIRIKDLMRKYPPEKIHELAVQDRITDEEKFEEIFEERYRKNHNYQTLKMYDDLLHYF